MTGPALVLGLALLTVFVGALVADHFEAKRDWREWREDHPGAGEWANRPPRPMCARVRAGPQPQPPGKSHQIDAVQIHMKSLVDRDHLGCPGSVSFFMSSAAP